MQFRRNGYRARVCRTADCWSATGCLVDDIGLWELNEAFACQVVYCRDRLGIDNDRLNVNGGAISIGHPFGMSGARMVGHALLEGAPQGSQVRGRNHVHRRGDGRRGPVRGGLRAPASGQQAA
ncbi:MAG: hypothetical protein U5K56_07095 [Halioglobus sp.]|nr:hypothetical protein [Halioglobus sp.]